MGVGAGDTIEVGSRPSRVFEGPNACNLTLASTPTAFGKIKFNGVKAFWGRRTIEWLEESRNDGKQNVCTGCCG